MSNRSGQAYALMVMTPVRGGEEAALRGDLAALPPGAQSPLGRLGTTHFARWLVLSQLVEQGQSYERDTLGSTYLIFTSNFDGELDDYVDGLLEHLGEELDQIWGHCVGYPGRDDPEAFAAYLRHNTIETSLFFSAYPDATVARVLAALELRQRLTAFAIATQGLPPDELRAAYAQQMVPR